MITPKLSTQIGTPVPQFNLTDEEARIQLEKLGQLKDGPLVPPPNQEELSARNFISPLVKLDLKDLVVVKPDWMGKLTLLLRLRKNQKNLTSAEWTAFIQAIEAIANAGVPAPTYQAFVALHVKAMSDHNAHEWGAHKMGGHDGRNFSAWHREYLGKLEARLRLANPLVNIPYWNWIQNPVIPIQLSNPADLAAWDVTRNFQPNKLPTQSLINALMSKTNFADFQNSLESVHDMVHRAVGGTMAGTTSPADPLFWLHHAFVDKLWSDWRKVHSGNIAALKPSNLTETLLEPPIITRKVSQVLITSQLGYVYE